MGLLFTYASVYQMLRGSLVVFTGIFSVIFLKRKLYLYHYLGIFLVMAGCAVVGLVSVLNPGSSTSAKNPLLGDVLVIAAQVATATQFVLEEKMLAKLEVGGECSQHLCCCIWCLSVLCMWRTK